MLGRLLQTAASTFSQHASSRPPTPLESVTEEMHTRDLLFPDITTLHTTQQNGLPLSGSRELATAKEAANYDNRGGLDVEYPNDVRIIIAQDANSRHHQPQVLYDSKPPKNHTKSESAKHDHDPVGTQKPAAKDKSLSSPEFLLSRRHHTVKPSRFPGSQAFPQSPVSPSSPESRFRSTFGDPPVRQSPFEQSFSDADTPQSRNIRDAKEELNALLGCMFGAPGFRLEPSTKLHVIPKEASDNSSHVTRNPSTPRPLSSSGFARKRTPLIRSTSAADVPSLLPGNCEDLKHGTPSGSRSAVMFTRLFSINLPDTSVAKAEGEARKLGPQPSRVSSSVPSHNHDVSAADSATKSIKQKKAPMYAIAVVLQLPSGKSDARLRSIHPHQALSSSGSTHNEHTPATWRAEFSVFSGFMDSRESGYFDPITKANISYILHHWSILSRSMELLEISARAKLFEHLERQIPLPPAISTPIGSETSAKTKAVRQPTQQSVYVSPDCLQNESTIRTDVAMIAQRIMTGLQTRRVVTGQGRWGAWREEARWIGRWAGNREQNFFFFNFLTAFLGGHTTWLQSLGPSWYRRRHASQQRAQLKDANRLQQRTVIVATDKMAARRLIFLLAGFLPSPSISSQAFFQPVPEVVLPYTESSPPGTATREFSFRRSGPAEPESIRNAVTEGNGHARSVSFSLRQSEGQIGSNSLASMDRHHRRESDTRSVKGMSLPMPYRIHEQAKSSTSTVLANSAAPVPHFTNLSIQESFTNIPNERPGSGDSLASIALSHNLVRSESLAHSFGGSGGRWGSMVSGFWSNNRDHSTDSSGTPESSHNSPAERKVTTEDQRRSRSRRLGQMVEEASVLKEGMVGNGIMLPSSLPGAPSAEDYINQKDPAQESSSARSIPQHRMLERVPFKISMNEDDGYVDISMPPNYSLNSSLASSFASIKLPGATLSASHEHHSPYGSCTHDSLHQRTETLFDVAGWLKAYQPDFAVQAVRPYDSLINDIKASMRTESQLSALPIHEIELKHGHEVNISVTLVADTTRFTVERLRLCRRKKIHSRPDPSTQAVTPDGSTDYEDYLIVEPVMDMDATLIDAIERILAQSSDSSRSPSRAPSPHQVTRPESIHSNVGLRRSASTLGNDSSELDNRISSREIPHRDCKKTVLGALEEVVKSVVEERDTEIRDRPGQLRREPDSTLREGVRRWLIGVEEGR